MLRSRRSRAFSRNCATTVTNYITKAKPPVTAALAAR